MRLLRAILSRLRRLLWPPQPLGRRGEAAAARYLRRRGYKILARSDHLSPGELDLVALDGRTIVFVEVKTRQSADAGHDVLEASRTVGGVPGTFRRDRHHLALRPLAPDDRALPQRLRRGREVGVLLVRDGQAIPSCPYHSAGVS